MLKNYEKDRLQVAVGYYCLSFLFLLMANVILVTNASIKAARILSNIGGILKLLSIISLYGLFIRYFFQRITAMEKTNDNQVDRGTGRLLRRSIISERNICRSVIIVIAISSILSITSIIITFAGGPVKISGIMDAATIGMELISAVLLTVFIFRKETEQDKEDSKQKLNSTQKYFSHCATLCACSFFLSNFIQYFVSYSNSVRTTGVMGIISSTFMFLGCVCV